MGNTQSTDAPQSPSPSQGLTPSKKSRERESSQHRGYKHGSSSKQTYSPQPLQLQHSSNERRGHSNALQGAESLLPSHPAHLPSNLVPSSPLASTTTSTAYAHAHAHAHAHATTSSRHTRSRSVTIGGESPQLPTDVSPRSDQSEAVTMGQSQSRHRPPSRSATLPPRNRDAAKDAKHTSPPEAIGLGMTVPDVDEGTVDARDYVGSYSHGPNDFSRPPRLPLPIETEHEPGSPIPSPGDLDAPALEGDDFDGTLGRRTSMLSSTTMDDDDAADIEAFVLEANPSQAKVPTRIDYTGEAKSVYVTGTFVKWERKFRLHRNPQGGGFSSTFLLPTGTHHLKFLVDGDMRASEGLPTTVDFTNALVNYIEVVATTPPAPDHTGVSGEPMPIPGTAVTAGQAPGTADGAAKPIDIRPAATTGDQHDASAATGHPDKSTDPHGDRPPQKIVMEPIPRPQYTSTIPPFLLHLDLYSQPQTSRYRRAIKVGDTLPTPPSLPGFMNKSILNATTPHKDDASVLSMPNHTVLNHLATSSIKNGVLATSGTTRYKRKFLTTIMYKPTTEV